MFAQPELDKIAAGLIPSLPGEAALYIAISIIGATVMPHNLYLHSSLVQTRKFDRTKEGVKSANYFGSLTQSSTVKVGHDTHTGQSVYLPFNSIVPLVHPNDLVLGGWDISKMNLADAMQRAEVWKLLIYIQYVHIYHHAVL
ncbi:hypothetical protein EON64_10570 [archaeon]|nr:MAG: hypothetical protein EON64_10570 [archaeon]